MVDEEKRPGGQAGALPKADQSETKKQNSTSAATRKPPQGKRATALPDDRDIEQILEEMHLAYFGFWAERMDISGDGEDEP